MTCPTCNDSMDHFQPGKWGCNRCLLVIDTRVDTAQMGTVAITEPADCCCGHSWYDHIGHRAAWDKKVCCRIVRCGCERYAEKLRHYSNNEWCPGEDS